MFTFLWLAVSLLSGAEAVTDCVSDASISVMQDQLYPTDTFLPPIYAMVEITVDEAIPSGGSIQLQFNDYAFANITDRFVYTVRAQVGDTYLTMNRTVSEGWPDPSVSLEAVSAVTAGSQVRWNVANILHVYPTLPSGTTLLGNFRVVTYDQAGTAICQSAMITPSIFVVLDNDPDAPPLLAQPMPGSGGALERESDEPDDTAVGGTCESVQSDLARTAKWIKWTGTNGKCPHVSGTHLGGYYGFRGGCTGGGAWPVCDNSPEYLNSDQCMIETPCEIYGSFTLDGKTIEVSYLFCCC
jgi:hypothetical protein